MRGLAVQPTGMLRAPIPRLIDSPLVGLHELAAAHSVEHFQWPEGTTKSDVVKMIGNMVPRRTAKALCLEMLA
jgi:hypothetical protein